MLIEEYLKSEVGNRIDFANDIMINNKRNKGEAMVHYKLIKYKKKREYKFLEYISANVTLVQLMDSLVNVNHAISVVGNWIFDSKYERALVLNRESLHIIYAPSVGGEQDAIFGKVFLLSDTFLMKQNLKSIVLIFPPKHSHNNLCCYMKE